MARGRRKNLIWGKSCNFAWLAALAAGYLLALCPTVAFAQNNAESQPPKPSSKQEQSEAKPADKQPENQGSGNVAEKAPAKKDEKAKDAKEAPPKPTGEDKPDVESKPKDTEPVNPTEAESKDKSDSPKGDKPDKDNKDNAEKPTEKADPKADGDKNTPSEPNPDQVAETSSNTPTPPDTFDPGVSTTKPVDTTPEPVDFSPAPDGNIAETEKTTPDTPVNSSTRPPLIDPPAIAPANSAENRPTGTSAQNTAEAGFIEDESEIAEPPEPHFSLPSPGEVAGHVADYIAPSDLLLDAPALENAPARLETDAFFQPTLGYLDRRPLPDINIEETSEEDIARSFEESLKLLNLAQETRTEGGIQVPLPSGVMTFKASDAFEFDRRNKILKFVGNAELVFDSIAIWADLIEVDDGAATAYAKGYVGIQEKDEILFCDEAYLNYDTKTLELFWVEGNTGGPKIEGAVFFEAERAYGSFDNLNMEKVKVTTCEPYCGGPTEMHMLSEKMRYQRGKSIVLINTYLYARKQKYFYIPMLAFPLDRSKPFKQGESDVDQTYGYQRSEGWFAKFAYTYSVRYAENVNRALLGVAKVELSEKQGPGFGIRQDFLVPSLGVATVVGFYQGGWPDTPLQRLYFQPFSSPPDMGFLSEEHHQNADEKKPTNFRFSLNQELKLSQALNGTLAISRRDTISPARNQYSDDQRNNNWSNKLNLNYKKKNTTASITGNQSVSITGGFTRDDNTQEPSRETTSNTGAVRYSTKFTKDLKFNFSQDYNASKGNSGNQNLPADQEGTLRMGLDWAGKRDSELEGYSAKLGYVEQGIDYDQDKNTTDRNRTIRKELPSLQINLPRDLFNDGAYFTNFSVNIDNLVTGRRRTPESSFRTKVSAKGTDNIKFSPSSSLGTNVGAEQYWYDDGNAQYTLSPRLNYTYKPKSFWTFAANWSMLYHQGVALPPVQGDRRTYSNRSSVNLTMSNSRSWRWKLSSGYDFKNHSSSPLSSTISWDPNRTFGVTQTMTYNLREHTFRPSRMSGYFRSPYVDQNGYYNWLLKLTWDHDIEHHMRTTRLDLRWLKRWGNGWTSDIQGGYRDGSDDPPELSDAFIADYIKRIGVRKTNCCTTIEGVWRTGINSFELNVYLNALPQYPSRMENFNVLDDEWETNTFFPVNQLQQDILNEQFGITQRLF